MRYTELQIETQRQAPAQARSEGAAYLRRAGYMDSSGKLTALGGRVPVRLAKLAKTMAAGELFAMLALPNLHTQDDGWFSTPGGQNNLADPSLGQRWADMYSSLYLGRNSGNFGPPRQIRFGMKLDI